MTDLTNFNDVGFDRWLKAQPDLNRAFQYCNPHHCLFATWLKETGICDTPHCLNRKFFTEGKYGAGHLLDFPIKVAHLDELLCAMPGNDFTLADVNLRWDIANDSIGY